MKVFSDLFRKKPCPCGSVKQSSECCLRSDGVWFKEPCNIKPREPKTGYSNPKCYISLYNDCSKKISAEHYMSKSLLKELGNEIELTGLPWIKTNEKKNIKKRNLVANILCRRHNSSLSSLDNEAGRFFRVLNVITDPNLSSQNDFFIFNGKDIERWMLKTLYGLIASKSLQASNNVRIISKIDNKCLTLLFDKITWEPFRGLYVRSEKGHVIESFKNIKVTPFINLYKNNLQGMWFSIRGFDFFLATTNVNVENSVYRPKYLIFNKDNKQKVIQLCWDKDAYIEKITF